jgi:N-acyl-D-aspartate/D-glutamate deacylase
LIVAPGLIEIHTHGEDDLNYRYRAMDGITTMLDTERGTVDVDKWYSDRQGKTLVNYGISAGHSPARVQVVGGEYHGFHFSGPARTDKASPEQIDRMASLVRKGLARGALGVGLMLFYPPGAADDEVRRMFEVAAEIPGAAIYVHLRYAGLGTKDQPGGVTALDEVLSLARQTKAPLHVCHVSTSGLSATPKLLEMIGAAKAQGLDVTTEFYPYTAAMSGIKSTWFDPGSDLSGPGRPSTQLGNISPRAGASGSRAGAADVDGRAAEDDADAGAATRSPRAGNEKQGPNSSGS